MTGCPALSLAAVLAFAIAAQTHAAPAPAVTAHTSEVSITVRGTPAEVYDAMTGEVSGWWDHGFVHKPRSRFIEAKPGGGFYEWFDGGSKNGVLHATVIYADRGKLLRMSGPLGFSGQSVNIVVSWAYAAVGDSTKVTVTSHVAGALEENAASQVERVWKHFIVDRFKPWYEQGGHRRRGALPKSR
jgi:hypothetical protein